MVRVVVLVIVLGLVAWLLTFLPIPEPFRTLVFVVMVVAVIWEVLALAGLVPSVIDRRQP